MKIEINKYFSSFDFITFTNSNINSLSPNQLCACQLSGNVVNAFEVLTHDNVKFFYTLRWIDVM